MVDVALGLSRRQTPVNDLPMCTARPCHPNQYAATGRRSPTTTPDAAERAVPHPPPGRRDEAADLHWLRRVYYALLGESLHGSPDDAGVDTDTLAARVIDTLLHGAGPRT